MHKHRYKYWSCSKFSDWLRLINNVKKPNSATAEEWVEWKKSTKNHNLILNWIADDGLDILQDIVYFIPDCWTAVRTYIRNRYFDKIHYLPTNLIPGQYYEVDTRILNGLFETLIDFVESEKAHMQLISCTDDERKQYNIPIWYKKWIRFKTWRCPQAGIDYLKWETTITHNIGTTDNPNEVITPQADVAKAILELYTWWKINRPKRPDPYETSGWATWCNTLNTDGDIMSFMAHKKTVEEKIIQKEILNRLTKLEEEYEQEDEDMMIRLIKIRSSLWT